MEFAANHWDLIGHGYIAIPFFNGSVLKYTGRITCGNVDWLTAQHPELVVLPDYIGDRIVADTYRAYTGAFARTCDTAHA